MFLRLFLLYDVGDRHNILNFVKKIGSLSIVGVVSFGDRPIAVSNGILMF